MLCCPIWCTCELFDDFSSALRSVVLVMALLFFAPSQLAALANALGRYNQWWLLFWSLGLLCIGILQLVINTSWSHSPVGRLIPMCKPTGIVQIISDGPDSFKCTVTIMRDKIKKKIYLLHLKTCLKNIWVTGVTSAHIINSCHDQTGAACTE
jgi:hypothetical protein